MARISKREMVQYRVEHFPLFLELDQSELKYQEIAELLNRHGLLSPTGKRWSASSVRRYWLGHWENSEHKWSYNENIENGGRTHESVIENRYRADLN